VSVSSRSGLTKNLRSVSTLSVIATRRSFSQHTRSTLPPFADAQDRGSPGRAGTDHVCGEGPSSSRALRYQVPSSKTHLPRI
jgi:hypothetical protein